MPFEHLGLPQVPEQPVNTVSEKVMRGTIPFALGWAAALTAVAGAVRLNKRAPAGTPGPADPRIKTSAAQPVKEDRTP